MVKIKKATLHMQIADSLREMIMTGQLKEGDKVNENRLCAVMEISKTPLREALRVLSSEGLIRLVPNRGSFVTKPSMDEIREMFDVMSLLEGFCARVATEKMNARSFARLEKLHAGLEEKYRRRDQEGYIRINNQYHAFLQELAGNRTMNGIVNGLRKKILLYRFQSLNLPERFDASIHEHRCLLEAFRNKDPMQAEALMKTHLLNQAEAMARLTRQ